jgi:polysaccharide pyruvyl transferase WcaK-like protein
MDKGLAQATLDVGTDIDESDLHDAYQEKLFELKQFFLRDDSSLKLLKLKVKRLLKLHEAFLLLSQSKELDIRALKFEAIDYNTFLGDYQKRQSQIKLFISQSFNALELVNAFELIKTGQRAYFEWLHIKATLGKLDLDFKVEPTIQPISFELLKKLELGEVLSEEEMKLVLGEVERVKPTDD